MQRQRSLSTWLAVGATSSALALTLALSAPVFTAPHGSGVAYAQSGSGSQPSGGSPQTPNTAPGVNNDSQSTPNNQTGQPNQQQQGTGTGTGTGTQQGTGTGSGAATNTQQATGTSGSQGTTASDPTRGGAESPGNPACYMPAANVTERRMYSLERPSCFPGHME